MPKFSAYFFVGLTLTNASHAVETVSGQGVVETLLVKAEPGYESLSTGLVIKPASEFLPGARIDVAETLHGLPGVQIDSRTNFAQDTRISLRGYGARSAFGVRGIDLLVDGVPMSMPDGQGQLSSVMADTINSVQVMRGPIAALYGNAAGGVIALQTAAPETSGVDANIAFGADGLRKEGLQVRGRNNNVGGNVIYSHMKQDGERSHASAEREQFGAQLFYEHDNDLEFTLKHELTDDPLLQDPLGLTPEQWEEDPHQSIDTAELFNTRKSVRHQQTSLSVRQSRATTDWQLAAWAGNRDIVQYLGFSGSAITSSGGVVDLDREFGGASASVSHDLDVIGRPLIATLGAEVAQMEDHRRGYMNDIGFAGALRRDEEGEVNSRDIYAVLQWKISEPVEVFSGARRTQVEFNVEDSFIVPAEENNPGNPDDSGARDYADTSYAAGLRFNVNQHWSGFVSYGRGFETPTLTEMAYRSQGAGLNTALEAATNEQIEMGVNYQRDNIESQLTAFLIDTENELVVDQSLNGRTSYTNAAATEREGVEWFGRMLLTDQWRVQTSFTWIDAIYSTGSLDGYRLPGVAREQYQLDVQYLPWSDERLVVSAGIHKRTSVAANDSNEVIAPGFYRFDIGVEGRLPVREFEFGWWCKLANLTDEKYVGSVIVNQNSGRSFEPAPGFQLSAGMQVSY